MHNPDVSQCRPKVNKEALHDLSQNQSKKKKNQHKNEKNKQTTTHKIQKVHVSLFGAGVRAYSSQCGDFIVNIASWSKRRQDCEAQLFFGTLSEGHSAVEDGGAERGQRLHEIGGCEGY